MISFTLPDNILQKPPTIHPSAFVAPGAQVIGDVTLHANASVWYNAVLRGDINRIVVGEGSNIQDGSILHLENELPCIVDQDVTVGHHCNLHGCHIEEGCLIGIGAIILSGAHIKKGCIIGAGTVVLENTVIDPFSMVVGVPGKKIRSLSPDTLETQKKWAQKYVQLSQHHKHHS